jgi:hypothetical protein
MGTDIHNMFERRTADGTWEVIHYTSPLPADQECRLGWRQDEAKEAGREIPQTLPVEYHRRHYDLFAILANVRNGTGFAGVVTGAGFTPLSSGRGVPSDASEEYQSWQANYGGHSHTWVTLAELLDEEWRKKVTTKVGILDKKEYLEWRKTNLGIEDPKSPSSWCGGVSGPSVVVLDATTVETQIRETGEFGASHVRVKWFVSYEETAQDFLDFLDKYIIPLGYDPHDVRMVMFFDS